MLGAFAPLSPLRERGWGRGRHPKGPGMVRRVRRAFGAPSPGADLPLMSVKTPQHVAVMGAGLAGCSVARSLALAGVSVTVVERAASIATGASAAPRMVVRPWLTRQPTLASTLSRQAFEHAVAVYRNHPAWEACRVMQRSKPGEDPTRMVVALSEQHWPPTLMRPVGHDDDDPRWFDIAQGGALNPRFWCETELARPGITVQLGRHATLTELLDDHDAVVVACAGATPEVLGQAMPMSRTRGQTTTLKPGALPDLTTVRCGDGYVAPLAHGAALVGASYDRDDDPTVRAESHAENLARLQRLTGATLTPDHIAEGWVGFRAAWPDRLPTVGPISADQRVWMAAGYASRGAVWAPLLGEVLAAGLLQTPAPLSRPLLEAMDPARLARWAGPS